MDAGLAVDFFVGRPLRAGTPANARSRQSLNFELDRSMVGFGDRPFGRTRPATSSYGSTSPSNPLSAYGRSFAAHQPRTSLRPLKPSPFDGPFFPSADIQGAARERTDSSMQAVSRLRTLNSTKSGHAANALRNSAQPPFGFFPNGNAVGITPLSTSASEMALTATLSASPSWRVKSESDAFSRAPSMGTATMHVEPLSRLPQVPAMGFQLDGRVQRRYY